MGLRGLFKRHPLIQGNNANEYIGSSLSASFIHSYKKGNSAPVNRSANTRAQSLQLPPSLLGLRDDLIKLHRQSLSAHQIADLDERVEIPHGHFRVLDVEGERHAERRLDDVFEPGLELDELGQIGDRGGAVGVGGYAFALARSAPSPRDGRGAHVRCGGEAAHGAPYGVEKCVA